jgi:SPP1 family predicted phage head-tail adaptor
VGLVIGKLRHRVTIQNVTITRNTRGAEVLTWSNLATVYADIRTVGGQEQVLASQLEVATLLHTVTIRYRSDITPKMRLAWGNRLFEVEAIIERDNRMRMLDLSCRELYKAEVVHQIGSPIGLLLTLTYSVTE